MKLKIVAIVLTATMFPALAYAQGCHGSQHRSKSVQTSSCAAGFFWDASKSACVPLTIS
ncbi:MAG: hypothetical protein GY947_00395 [Rhodobacteraceae bacterium]|nr:hypothetical protein [Paracoccaceae bacterium]